MNEHLNIDTIIDYLHGELPPAADALTHAHLQACGPCRSEYEREASLSESLRVAARNEERELPPAVKAAVWQAVRNERPSLSLRLAAFLRPAIALPTAAALVLVTYFASPLSHSQHATRSVDAMYYLEQHAAEQMLNPLAERSSITSPVLETSEATATTDNSGSRTPILATLDAME